MTSRTEAFYVVHTLGDAVMLAYVDLRLGISRRLTKGSDGWVDDPNMLDFAWDDSGQEITREEAEKIAHDWGFELPTSTG